MLKLVATLFGFVTAILAMLLAANIWLEERSIEPVKIALLVSLLVLAGFTSVQIWRLKHSGRYAGLCLIVGMAIQMVIGRPGGLEAGVVDLCYLGVGIGLATTLVLPASQRVCS